MTPGIKKFKIAATATVLIMSIALIAQSCGSKYNYTKFKDVNAGNPEVYGDSVMSK